MNEHGSTRTLAIAAPDWFSIGFGRLRLTIFRIDTPAFGLFGLVLERGDRAQGFLALRDGSARQANYDLTGEAAQTAQLIYVHSDHLSTPRLATDDTQAVLWRWAGLAFGNTAPVDDPDGDGIKTIFNLRFPGQYHDTESGLYYNWNRYYDPGKGRYVTSDPIGLGGGSNTYGYVGQNPVVNIDPTGLDVYPPPGDEDEREIIIPWPDFIDTPCERRCYLIAQGCRFTPAGIACTPIAALFATACIQSFCEDNDLCFPGDFSGS